MYEAYYLLCCSNAPVIAHFVKLYSFVEALKPEYPMHEYDITIFLFKRATEHRRLQNLDLDLVKKIISSSQEECSYST